MIGLPLWAATAWAAPVDELCRANWTDAFRAPAREALVRAEDLFRRLLQGDNTPELGRDWQALGLQLTVARNGEDPLLILHEPKGHLTGAGLYAFRLGEAAAVALQAPHGRADLGTGELAERLFAEGPVRALACNTASRRARAADGTSADAAHTPDHYFTAFTRAFARVYPAGLVVQLHGFSRSARNSEAGRQAEAILSAGQRWASPAATAVGYCLRQRLSQAVRLYPADVAELGGTRNVQGRTLRALGHGGFLHLELSLELRESMNRDAASRNILLDCLTEAARR